MAVPKKGSAKRRARAGSSSQPTVAQTGRIEARVDV